MPKIMISGGFDPIHTGHIELIKAAAKFGDVIVALNSDEWLRRKKGYVFMTWEERADVLLAIKGVTEVHGVADLEDGTVANAIRISRPDFFANGGDRVTAAPAEHAACVEVGCVELFNVGGEKFQSSSALVDKACAAKA